MFYRRPRGRRETKKRQPPIPLPRKLIAHLRRWKEAGQRFCVEWNGSPVKDVDKGFRAAVEAAKIGKTITPHTLRHTRATWLMQAGADPWEASEYLGMTLQTLMDHYGHHHPDHLTGPRNIIDSPPQGRHKKPGTERDFARSNVIKLAGNH